MLPPPDLVAGACVELDEVVVDVACGLDVDVVEPLGVVVVVEVDVVELGSVVVVVEVVDVVVDVVVEVVDVVVEVVVEVVDVVVVVVSADTAAIVGETGVPPLGPVLTMPVGEESLA